MVKVSPAGESFLVGLETVEEARDQSKWRKRLERHQTVAYGMSSRFGVDMALTSLVPVRAGIGQDKKVLGRGGGSVVEVHLRWGQRGTTLAHASTAQPQASSRKSARKRLLIVVLVFAVMISSYTWTPQRNPKPHGP